MDVSRLLEPDEEIAFRVEPGEAGQRLDRLLARRIAWISRARLARWIREGRVELDGAPAPRAGRLAAVGQQVRLVVPKTPRDRADSIEDLLEIPIVQRGDGWLVVDKPAGIPSHPSGGAIKRTLLVAIAIASKGTYQEGGPWLPHRLDRQTSGLHLVALRLDVQRRLAAAFAAGSIRRFYRAQVRGVLEPSEAWVDLRAPLRVASTHPLRVAVAPDGQPAHTRLQAVRAGSSRSEVRLEAVTGRAHQLRVHLAHLGHPIVGDPAYDPETPPGERMRLHADELWIPAEAAGSPRDVVVRASALPFPVTPPG